MKQKSKILLVDDDGTILQVLSLVLSEAGYEVFTAPNGQVAESLLEASQFKCVITDMNMPGYGGLELLKYVRSAHPDTPVVLMTGFTKIIETKTAFELGAKAFLAKPFQQAELLSAIADACGPTELAEIASAIPIVKITPEYCRIGIDQFISGKSIKFEIFISLKDAKYIKVAHAGEDINLERIRSYKSKGVDFLYIKRHDFAQYVGFNLKLTTAVRENSTLSRERKFQVARLANTVILESLFVNGLSRDIFEQAKEVTETTLGLLTDSDRGLDLIEALSANGDHLFTHSLGVSLFSAMIAKEIGWDSAPTLFKISTAGLFHDIGMKEIDRSIVDKPRALLTQEEVKHLETHAARGAAILGCMPEISEEILQTVVQHHETFDGRGYPAKISGGKIISMARLVSIADQFCEIALADANSPGVAPGIALDRLSLIITNPGDLIFLNALRRVLGQPVDGSQRGRMGAS